MLGHGVVDEHTLMRSGEVPHEAGRISESPAAPWAEATPVDNGLRWVHRRLLSRVGQRSGLSKSRDGRGIIVERQGASQLVGNVSSVVLVRPRDGVAVLVQSSELLRPGRRES